jgi:hypothetical protein
VFAPPSRSKNAIKSEARSAAEALILSKNLDLDGGTDLGFVLNLNIPFHVLKHSLNQKACFFATRETKLITRVLDVKELGSLIYKGVSALYGVECSLIYNGGFGAYISERPFGALKISNGHFSAQLWIVTARSYCG